MPIVVTIKICMTGRNRTCMNLIINHIVVPTMNIILHALDFVFRCLHIPICNICVLVPNLLMFRLIHNVTAISWVVELILWTSNNLTGSMEILQTTKHVFTLYILSYLSKHNTTFKFLFFQHRNQQEFEIRPYVRQWSFRRVWVMLLLLDDLDAHGVKESGAMIQPKCSRNFSILASEGLKYCIW